MTCYLVGSMSERAMVRRQLVWGIVFASLGVLPLSASAQTGKEATTSKPNLQEPAPPSERAPEEPALQLKLDDAGVKVVPSPPADSTYKRPLLASTSLRIRRSAQFRS